MGSSISSLIEGNFVRAGPPKKESCVHAKCMPSWRHRRPMGTQSVTCTTTAKRSCCDPPFARALSKTTRLPQRLTPSQPRTNVEARAKAKAANKEEASAKEPRCLPVDTDVDLGHCVDFWMGEWMRKAKLDAEGWKEERKRRWLAFVSWLLSTSECRRRRNWRGSHRSPGQ